MTYTIDNFDEMEFAHFLLSKSGHLNVEDCKNHIKDLLASFREKYESTICKNSLVMFYVLKTYLKIYDESLCSAKSENFSKLPTKPIFDIITECLNKSRTDDQLNNAFDEFILQFIPLLFKIALGQQTEEDVSNIINFNNNNISALKTDENFSSVNFFQRLKILSVVFNSLSNTSGYSKDIMFSINSSENYICELFGKIVLNAKDKVAVYTLLSVIPQYTVLCRNYLAIVRVWKHISSVVSDEQYSRVLVIMCYFINFCFDESKLEDKKDIMVLFFEDTNFWKLVQIGLIEKNPVMKKQAMYILKKSIFILGSNDVVCESEIFFWNLRMKSELQSIYNEIIIILEFLDEQQTHIVQPIFQMVEKLVDKISKMKEKIIDFSWIILIYEKSIMHESTQVLKWGIVNMLKLPEVFFCDIEKVARILVPTLSTTSIYYNDSLELNQDLIKFFQKISSSEKHGKKFFSVFLEELCKLTWSPEALYFVTYCTSQLGNHSFWGENEIIEIKKFTSKIFKTHNKVIRSGVQCQLLSTIVKLTDTRNVSLKNIILLLSVFCDLKTLQKSNNMWVVAVNWLRSSYSVNEAEKLVEEFETKSLGLDFNEKSTAVMLMLFYDTYTENTIVTNVLLKILQSFKDIQKRLYCDKSICNYYLLIICCLLEENLNDKHTLLNIILPFFNDILLYIQTQIKFLTNLEDFDICESYVKTFTKIVKIQEIHKIDLRIDFSSFYENIVKDLKSILCSDSSIPSMLLYCEMELLKIMIESPLFKNLSKSCFIYSYLLKKVNETLKKDERDLGKTKNIQMLWGKMNSKFLEIKWQILEHHLRDLSDGSENILRLCEEALSIGGYGVLSPVMAVLKKFILEVNDVSTFKEIVYAIWKTLMERRKTDEFKLFIKQFGEMVFQEKLLAEEKHLHDIFEEFTNLIFSDSSQAVVNIFIKHMQQIPITSSTTAVLCQVVARGLIYGPVLKKDERLTAQICSYIELSELHVASDYPTSNEIRARTVQIILGLDFNNSVHRNFAKSLIKTLIKMENDLNKNKVRYFGDSHVHRVKHRLLQALLLLEPMLQPREKEAEELLKWLYASLMSENSQPSVKYQQEWLLIRMLIRCSDSVERFWNYFSDSFEKKTKGLCSLIAIAYHLCKLIPHNLTSPWIDQAVYTFLPFCMAQQFEIRLYAQVALEKIYTLAKSRNLNEVTQKYGLIYQCVLKSIENGCKGNAGKNCIKLQEDFYLNVFHPVEHYSLQTIYLDLPRLASIGSDEWISPKLFRLSGVLPERIRILVENTDTLLQEVDCAKWVVDKSSPGVRFEENADEMGENYQKKMIPLKGLVPEWDEAASFGDNCRSNALRKDGLIVVASLIDKIPNLGGLARTCEIFGASEYVINSLKYLEDKQFTSLSVTAEKWVTVKEVKVQNLLHYILEMKEMGYIVVGAEQALHSQPLGSVRFPEKTLLLLGNEKTGIPPNILPLLDICVEIPQVGIIRSLNVHVTGALFIWEYAKQNHFS